MKILLAEDDAEVAKFIIAGFEESGHSVDHVTDGRDALSYCMYNECEVAVLDRMMPGMDGLNVLKALRAAGQNMRNAGRIVTRTMLLEKVWNFNFDPNTSVVETHISRLRSKVDKPFDVPLIHTIRNTGYSMHGPR